MAGLSRFTVRLRGDPRNHQHDKKRQSYICGVFEPVERRVIIAKNPAITGREILPIPDIPAKGDMAPEAPKTKFSIDFQ